MLGHGGGFPGFITRTWFDPVDRLAVSVLTNAVDGPAPTLASGDPAPRRPGRRGRTATPPATSTPYTGRFATLWGVIDVVALGGRLYALDPDARRPDRRRRQRLEVVDADTLRIAEAPGYGSPGERYVYDRDGDGAVRAVRGGSGTTALPDDVFTAAARARRDRIRRGDRAAAVTALGHASMDGWRCGVHGRS